METVGLVRAGEMPEGSDFLSHVSSQYNFGMEGEALNPKAIEDAFER